MKNTEKKALSSQRKRAIFKERFAKMLLPLGFQFCGSRFLRLHEGELLLQLGMELSRTGGARIRFGGLPLCVENIDFSLLPDECVEDFAQIHPFPEGKLPSQLTFEDGQFDLQAELFEEYLLEDFAKICDVRSLLAYQENILEAQLKLLPPDLAAWECIHLQDYEKALQYAHIWEELEEARLEEYCRQEEEALQAADLTEYDRRFKRKDMLFRCKCRRHDLYAVQRLIGLLEDGVEYLLQANIQRHIAAGSAAFHQTYPDYRTKE